MEPSIKKRIRNGSAYYRIFWSRLKSGDKYDIICQVPSVSGIFELYFMDDKKKLNLFYVGMAWYGGLRNSIRLETDVEKTRNPKIKKVLACYKCYFRYSMSDSFSDLSDILYFFSKTYFPKEPAPDHSNRYIDIFIKEVSKDKIITI